MGREFGVMIYLVVVRVLFSTFKLWPLKHKTTCIASFGDNIQHTVKALQKESTDPIIILKTPQCNMDFEPSKHQSMRHFTPVNPVEWVSGIYHLATSRYVMVDNYYGLLAATHFKDGAQCIQLWHAAGAVKQFGLQDPSIKHRSKRAHQRFRSVYNRFDKVVAGSDTMADILKKSFGIADESLLRTGVPRTDFFFDQEVMDSVKQQLTQTLPMTTGKKVILYAPTYRDDELHVSDLHIDISQMHQQLGDEYVLLLRLHPATEQQLDIPESDFVVNMSHYPNVNHLLTITDILITDYSSIPFEFALLQRPMIFFAYDWESYKHSRGFYEEWESLIPGPVAETTAEIVDLIQHHSFDLTRIQAFSEKWNQYSNGRASENLIAYLYENVRKPLA